MRKLERVVATAELAAKIEDMLKFADRVGASATALWLDRALVEAFDEARRLGAMIEMPTDGFPYGRVLVDARV